MSNPMLTSAWLSSETTLDAGDGDPSAESRFRPAMPSGEAPAFDDRRTCVGAAGLRGVVRSPCAMTGAGELIMHAMTACRLSIHSLRSSSSSACGMAFMGKVRHTSCRVYEKRTAGYISMQYFVFLPHAGALIRRRHAHGTFGQ